MLIVSILAAALPLPGAWTIRRLTSDAGSSLLPRIAVQGTNVYVVWQHSTPGRDNIRLRRSTDGGATWKSVQHLTTTATDARDPRIAATGSNVCVVWGDQSAGRSRIYFRRSLNGGKTWQAQRLVRQASHFAWNPDVAASGSNVYVAWSELIEGQYVLYVRTSADGGVTWRKERMLATFPKNSHAEEPALAAFGASVYLAWQRDTSGNAEIMFQGSGDGGASWRSPRRFGRSMGDSGGPQIVASGRNVWLSWHAFSEELGQAEIWFSRSTDRGGSWKDPQRLTKNAGSSIYPVLAADGSNLYLAWSDETPGNPEIFFRTSADGGATWAGPMRITRTAGRSYRPAIAADGSNVYLVWYDDTPGNAEVYFGFRSPGPSASHR